MFTKEELIEDMKNEGFEFYTLEDEKQIEADKEIVEIMEELNCNILLSNPRMARIWYFTDLDAVYTYFQIQGKQVGFDNASQKLL